MNTITTTIHEMLTTLGVRECSVTLDEEHRKINVVVDDHHVQAHLAEVVASLDHLANLLCRKENERTTYTVDVNFYRKERERLIAELARAAARKAVGMKQDMELPPMNAYERRLVHVEIATHPELRTESAGDGKERRVVIKYIRPTA